MAALSMALGAIFWSQAVIAEVYTSASAFLAGVLVLVLCWYRSRRGGFLFWAGFLGGLSLGVHGSVGLAAPAVGLLVGVNRPNWKKELLPALGGAVLGGVLMSAAYLAIDANPAPYNIFDAAYRPAISAWDRGEADISTPLQRFVFNISAVQWRPAMFADPARVMPEKALAYAKSLPQNAAWPVLVLMPLGLVLLFFKDWRLGLFALLALLTHDVYTFNYNIGDNYVFSVPGAVYTSLLAACGSGILLKWVGRLPGRLGRPAVLGAGILLLGLAVQPFAADRLERLRKGEAVFEFAGTPSPFAAQIWYEAIRTSVSKMEPNAIGYIGWNDLYAFTYAAWVDLGRTDLRFLEPTPYSQKGGMALSMLDFIRSNLGKRPQYFQYPIDAVTNAGIALDTRNVGPVRLYQVVGP